ncbi:ThuA domain-containing protein [Draconibacterium sp. IB214405]|uniref:ThuA domain-containing protein n=1 Tax=Draconibacterium sp. IB214405 TaxID=3097352 RepID=UPI002A10BAC4|nr:ThuA domain-containing protein [Draconibacterium sp. IB214405]MDX8340491.1 ThuA domain-containing protein [Draconibacterium sp. IB214405]
MKKLLLFFLFSTIISLTHAQPIKVMLVTGGHSYDTVEFFNLFDQMSEIEYEHFAQPEANNKIASGLGSEFDVLVFYDMWDDISSDEKAAYLRLTKQGKPFLFLHHALASYQKWPAFEQLIGGRYVEENDNIPEDEWSEYEHDVWVYCSIENYTPVTAGFRELRFFDEVYDNIRISDEVKPLLRTRHPKSAEYVAWENHYNASTIVYIQPGHDKRTYENEDYRKLLLQAIQYLNTSN